MSAKSEFGDILRKARKRAGLSAREVAEEIGVSLTFIYDIEKGRKSPKLETVTKLASVYNNSELISDYTSMRDIPITTLFDAEVWKVYDRWRSLEGSKYLESKNFSPRELRDSVVDFRNQLVHGMVDDIIEKDPNAIHKIMLFLQKYAEDLTNEDDE